MKIADRIQNHQIMSSKLVAALTSENGNMILAETPIRADGYFEMVLPEIVLGYSYLFSPQDSCKKIKVCPETLKIAFIDAFWLFDPNETILGHVFQGASKRSPDGALSEKIMSRWYANQNGEINGQASCGPHGASVNFKLSLKKGWNEVVRHFRSGAQESIYSCKDVDGSLWFMILSDSPDIRFSIPNNQKIAAK